jgi:peptidoglycan hydrolase-like protein with peptidoglycan-binding domain
MSRFERDLPGLRCTVEARSRASKAGAPLEADIADLSASYGQPCRPDTFVTVRVFGRQIPFVRAGANALLRAAMAAYDLDYAVRRIESYNCRRTISGGSRSAHSWAAAVDINPETNPFSSKGKLVTDMPAAFRAAFTDHGFGWGGNWRSVKDAMHFSLDHGEGGSAPVETFDRDLQARADAKWDQRGTKPRPQPPKPAGKAPPWRHDHPAEPSNPRNRHGKCDTVRQWQAQMKSRGWDIDVDAYFGDASERVCRAFQREKSLAIDGILGPDTWRASWDAPVR